jgi:hypothetical protein
MSSASIGRSSRGRCCSLLLCGSHRFIVLLNILEVFAQGVLPRSMKDGGRFTCHICLWCLIITTRVWILHFLPLLESLVFFDSVKQVLHLDANLSLVWLVLDKSMLEELVRVRALVVILD